MVARAGALLLRAAAAAGGSRAQRLERRARSEHVPGFGRGSRVMSGVLVCGARRSAQACGTWRLLRASEATCTPGSAQLCCPAACACKCCLQHTHTTDRTAAVVDRCRHPRASDAYLQFWVRDRRPSSRSTQHDASFVTPAATSHAAACPRDRCLLPPCFLRFLAGCCCSSAAPVAAAAALSPAALACSSAAADAGAAGTGSQHTAASCCLR